MSSKKNVNSLVSGLQTTAASRMQLLAGGKQEREERMEPSHKLVAAPRVQIDPGFGEYLDTYAYEPGDRIILPIQHIAENPRNPRVFFAEEAMRDLIRSVAKTGIQSAVQVYPRNDEGKYVLKSGHRRTRAVRMLGQIAVKAEVVAFSGDALQDYREAREINREHRSHGLLDDAVRFKQLLEDKDVPDQQALAATLGITDAEVSKHLSIGTLPLIALQEMAESAAQCGLTASYLLYRYWATSEKDDEGLLKLVKRVVAGKVTTRQLEQLVQQQKPGLPERKREHAYSRIEVSGYANGELKAFDGKLTLKLENLSNDKRDSLFRRIVVAFEEAGLDTGGTSGNAESRIAAAS
jgi:ParB/RepB/Spo0J family partition protein